METHDLRQGAYADTLTSCTTPDLSHATLSNHLGLSTNPHELYPCLADTLPYRRPDVRASSIYFSPVLTLPQIFPESSHTFNDMAVGFSVSVSYSRELHSPSNVHLEHAYRPKLSTTSFTSLDCSSIREG